MKHVPDKFGKLINNYTEKLLIFSPLWRKSCKNICENMNILTALSMYVYYAIAASMYK